MRYQFFQRFYGPQSRANADDCVAKVRALFPQIQSTTEGPLTSSINAFTTATDIEVAFHFASEAEMQAVRGDPRCKAVYMEFGSKGFIKGNFAERKPGDPGGMTELLREGGAGRLPGMVGAVAAMLRDGPPVRGAASSAPSSVGPRIGRARPAEDAPASPAPQRPRNRG